MRLNIATPLFLLLAHLWAFPATAQEAPCVPLTENTSSVCFTPGSDCTGQIEQVLDSARKNIRVQAFSFTSSRIADALIRAKQRGVNLEILLDREKAEEGYKAIEKLKTGGVTLFLDGGHQSAHNKVMIVDGESVVTGSFNFTKAAQSKNAENVLVLRGKAIAELYLKNWLKHREHSKAYNFEGPPPRPSRSQSSFRQGAAQEAQGQSSRK